MTDNVAAPLPKGKCPHVLIAELQAENAESRQQLATWREALDAAHYYIDASDIELLEAQTTREGALLAARVLRKKALAATAPAAGEAE